MIQEDIFLEGEGDAWFERNEKKLNPQDDPILKTIDDVVGFPTTGNCLEVGCANGWRVEQIKNKYGLEPYGLEPSYKAVTNSWERGINAMRGVADFMPWTDNNFDVVIFGFCLYLCSRERLFKSIAEGDRVLKDKGLMIVHDFSTVYPCKNPYKHKDGLWSYKQDYSMMFLANPAYRALKVATYVGSTQDIPMTKVTIMRKDIERGWPLCVSVL